MKSEYDQLEVEWLIHVGKLKQFTPPQDLDCVDLFSGMASVTKGFRWDPNLNMTCPLHCICIVSDMLVQIFLIVTRPSWREPSCAGVSGTDNQHQQTWN